MFRFRLGGIPIEIHASHLAISGLVAWSAVEATQMDAWPALDPKTQASWQLTYALCIALWMSIVSVSILVHELGHAIASRVFGYRPTIHLVGLGGLTHPNANETVPWHREVLMTLAGPFSGLALGLFAGGLWQALVAAHVGPGPVIYVLKGLFAANLVWAFFNLLPVSSFDGGKISTALLMRIIGRPGFLVAQLISVFLSVLLIAVFWTNWLLVAIVGLNIVRAMALISAYFRGEQPPLGPQHPFELAFAQAQKVYAAGKLEDAAKLLEQLVAHDLQPQLRSQAHDLAGWIQVKLGNGRPALDHFAQVQGMQVAPQAVAAAFSLIGDDLRALPLWEQAARASNDPTLLHEWAGAFIRNRQPEKGLGLPGVRRALAFAAAARTWFVRKDYPAAAAANEASFREEPNAERAYDAACAYALAANPIDALRMLGEAIAAGVRPDRAQWDPELASLRGDPRFTALIKGAPPPGAQPMSPVSA